MSAPIKPPSTNWLSRLFGRASVALPVRVGATDFLCASAPIPTREREVDYALIGVTVALLLWGWVMVYSASIALTDSPRYAQYTSTYFLVRHAQALVIGLVAAVVTFQFSMRTWEYMASWFFIGALMLLMVVLLPYIGKEVNGARRWIPLGFMNFQPSELAKLAIAIYAAGYMVRKMEVKQSFIRAVVPMGFAVAFTGVLLLAEPDMGAFVVIAATAMGVLFLGGVNMRAIIVIGVVIVVAFVSMVVFTEWRNERLLAYLDPWNDKYKLGKSYQLTHALIAVGRGELFGVGLGGSVEKLFWLPEAHTDFITAIIGEEMGLAGLLCMLVLFFWMVRRIMHIGRQAVALDRVFSGLAAQGIGLWFGVQTFINIGVNLGVLPTKGLTLPFMSYGGSSIMMNMVAMAVVLRVDYENRVMMQKGRKA